MRSLVLAGILSALVGCSMPYADTSFKATPKPQHKAEGEHREVSDRLPAGGHGGAEAVNLGEEGTKSPGGEVQTETGDVYAGGVNPTEGADVHGDVPRDGSALGNGGRDQVGAVFPKTAQPGDDTMPSAR